jgi:hypothetical protein
MGFDLGLPEIRRLPYQSEVVLSSVFDATVHICDLHSSYFETLWMANFQIVCDC